MNPQMTEVVRCSKVLITEVSRSLGLVFLGLRWKVCGTWIWEVSGIVRSITSVLRDGCNGR